MSNVFTKKFAEGMLVGNSYDERHSSFVSHHAMIYDALAKSFAPILNEELRNRIAAATQRDESGKTYVPLEASQEIARWLNETLIPFHLALAFQPLPNAKTELQLYEGTAARLAVETHATYPDTGILRVVAQGSSHKRLLSTPSWDDIIPLHLTKANQRKERLAWQSRVAASTKMPR